MKRDVFFRKDKQNIRKCKHITKLTFRLENLLLVALKLRRKNPCSALFPKLKMGIVVYMSTIFENSVAKLSTVEVKIHSLTLKCNNNSLKKFVAVLVKVLVSILLL